MTTETKLLIAAVVADVLWVASIGYVLHDTKRRGAPRLRWALAVVLAGPAAVAYWLLTRRRHTTTGSPS